MTSVLSLATLPAQTTPAAQYSAWAAELGVSDTSTLMGLDGDDATFAFQLATGCIDPLADRAEFSTEGLIGWSKPVKSGALPPGWFSRMYYQGNTPPDYFLAFRYEGFDCYAMGVKLQKAAGVTILTGKIRKYTDVGDRVEFAIRFPANSVDLPQIIVKTEGSFAATAYVWRLVGGSPAYPGVAIAAGLVAWLEVRSADIAANMLPLAVLRRSISPENAAAAQFNYRGFSPAAIVRNLSHRGKHRIAGTVKEEGSPDNRPVSRRVLLIDQRANIVVRETWSDPITGAYLFDYLNPDIQYLVISFDYKQNFRAVVADNLTAEPMP